jgi:pimeloyl-ACP methyl ester carboxylesterase
MELMPEAALETTVNGERVRYYRSGAGPAVVLLHGLGGAGVVCYRTMPGLMGRYDVIAPDLWGPGRYAGEALSIETGVGFGQGLLDATGVSDAHLVGSSLGGLIAGHVALRHPERVRSLTLVDSAGLGRHIAWSQRLIAVPGVGELFFRPTRGRVQRMLRLLVRKGQIDEELAEALYEDSRAPGVLRQMLAALREGVTLRGVKAKVQLLPTLASAGKPTLVMWGSDDPLFPVAQARDAANALHATLAVFDGVGHWPYLEAHEEFNARLIGFLDGVESST